MSEKRDQLYKTPLKGTVQGGELVLRIPLELIAEVHLREAQTLTTAGEGCNNSICLEGPVEDRATLARRVSLFIDTETLVQVTEAKTGAKFARPEGPR